MLRTRGQVTCRDKHRAGEKDHGDAMVLETPFDLALYTPEFTQSDSPAKNFRDGDAAWTKFLAARPMLYLPNRSPVTDEDPINRHRRLWTHQELQAFGEVVEERTRVQLLAQERTLRRWHQSATHVQRCFRGMRGRFHVLRLRQEHIEYAATLEAAMGLVRERRRQRKAAVAIQRGYRCHRRLVIHRQRAAIVLQGTIKRFLHRLRSWQACSTLQRAARCFLWKLRWQRYKQRVRKMLNAAAREQKVVLATETFRRVRENVLLQRQADTWAAHPEQMQMLLRARWRKQTLRTSAAVGVFPQLQSSTKHQNRAIQGTGIKKPVRHRQQQQQNLPRIQPSNRRE